MFYDCVFQSQCLLCHTWLPDVAPASSGQPCPGKIWQVRSESAWSARTPGADPCSRDSPEQATTLKKDEDKTPIIYFTTCLETFFEMTFYFVAHRVFTNLANASVGSIWHPRHDSLLLYLIKHRCPADWLESISQTTEAEFQSWKWL